MRQKVRGKEAAIKQHQDEVPNELAKVHLMQQFDLEEVAQLQERILQTKEATECNAAD